MSQALSRVYPGVLVDWRARIPISIVAIVISVVAAAFVLVASFCGWMSLLFPLCVGGVYLLFRCPEIALGCLLVVGTFKGAPQFADSPIDVTVILVIILAWSIGRAILKNSLIVIPGEFLFYLPILFMALLSLMYTPDLSAGIDKAARFFIICGVAALAPFAVLTAPDTFRRFFWTLLVAGLSAAILSLPMLGGHARLTTPGGDTIQLGHVTAVAIAVVWFGLLPGRKLLARLALYCCIAVLTMALIGSGSRGPLVGLGVVILISIWRYRLVGFTLRQLLLDSAFLGFIGALVLPFISIPEQSLEYLGRLVSFQSTYDFLGPRAGLLQLGWKLTLEHPLTGVGIGGFPTLYTGVGNWPHSIPLEISSELGLLPALSFCCLLFFSLITALREFAIGDTASRTDRSLMFCLVVIVTISMLNTGNLNDNRQLWTALSLPFLLRTTPLAETRP